jgi:flavin-dependent dehydrogenase
MRAICASQRYVGGVRASTLATAFPSPSHALCVAWAPPSSATGEGKGGAGFAIVPRDVDVAGDAMAAACDVLVVGGGPGGSTVAAVLAGRGRDVVVVEKAQHPRFHIGESLLPANIPLFEQLGIAEDVRKIGEWKPGAEFVSDAYDKSNVFFFASASHLVAKHSYQVRRATFDHLLFEHARRCGAKTVENTRVTGIDFATGERPLVTAVGPGGETLTWRPRFVVDASGRDTLLASQLGLKTANKRNNSAAIFGHFEGVPRRPGKAAGIISLHLVEDGWFWMIPLPDGPMSVGLVGNPSLFKNRRGASIADLFWSTVRSSQSVRERMAEARLIGELTTTSNYSYTARTALGPHHLMIGDAYRFIDPIFSSGVMIAMTSGIRGGEAIALFLRDERGGRRALRRFEREVARATAHLAWLMYRINDPVIRFLFLHPNNRFGLRDGLLSLLAGEIFDLSRATQARVLAFRGLYYVMRAFGRRVTEPKAGMRKLEVSAKTR